MLGEMIVPVPLQSGHGISSLSLFSTTFLPWQVGHFFLLLLNSPIHVLPPGFEPGHVGLKVTLLWTVELEEPAF
jgi:hypothetical protein